MPRGGRWEPPPRSCFLLIGFDAVPPRRRSQIPPDVISLSLGHHRLHCALHCGGSRAHGIVHPAKRYSCTGAEALNIDGFKGGQLSCNRCGSRHHEVVVVMSWGKSASFCDSRERLLASWLASVHPRFALRIVSDSDGIAGAILSAVLRSEERANTKSDVLDSSSSAWRIILRYTSPIIRGRADAFMQSSLGGKPPPPRIMWQRRN